MVATETKSPATSPPVAQAPSERFRFIPYRRADIVEMILDEGEQQDTGAAFDAKAFKDLANLLQATFHFEFHDELERMKSWYAPFNPDSQTRNRPPRTEAELSESASSLARELSGVLEKGNYEQLTLHDVEAARHHSSLIQLRVEVDFDAFEELVLFARGESEQEITYKRWYHIKPRKKVVPTYERVCLYVRFKAEATGARRRTGLAFEPGTSILKLFRNIPKADLEMLFPNCAVRMRATDKLLLGVPAVAGGIPVLLKMGPALVALGIALGVTTGSVLGASLIPGITGLVVLGLYLFRQWDKFKNRKVLFLKVLSENLYFRNLDNNEGVLTHLVDEAEEEECKEAMLGYAFLLWAEGPLTEAELDAQVERWLRERHKVEVDFEVGDAVGKLERFGFVSRDAQGLLVAAPVTDALAKLDRLWDNYFPYGNEAQEQES